MPAYADIQAALDLKLSSFANMQDYPVAWTDVKFTPTNVPYLSASFIPAETDTVGLSVNDVDDNKGIYQINVNTPKGGGTADQRVIVSNVLTEFAKATVTSFNTSDVLIEQSWASAAFDRNDSWVTVPVSVRYRLFK